METMCDMFAGARRPLEGAVFHPFHYPGTLQTSSCTPTAAFLIALQPPISIELTRLLCEPGIRSPIFFDRQWGAAFLPFMS